MLQVMDNPTILLEVSYRFCINSSFQRTKFNHFFRESKLKSLYFLLGSKTDTYDFLKGTLKLEFVTFYHTRAKPFA